MTGRPDDRYERRLDQLHGKLARLEAQRRASDAELDDQAVDDLLCQLLDTIRAGFPTSEAADVLADCPYVWEWGFECTPDTVRDAVIEALVFDADERLLDTHGDLAGPLVLDPARTWAPDR